MHLLNKNLLKKKITKADRAHLKLLIKFLGQSTLDANRYESKIAQGFCTSTTDILKYVCHCNIPKLKPLRSCHNFYLVKQNRAMNVRHHTHTLRGEAKANYAKSAQIFTPLDVCAYLTNQHQFRKYVFNVKQIDLQYINDVKAMLQKVANNMTKQNIKVIKNLLTNEDQKLIPQIKTSARLVRNVSDHIIKYKWILFKHEFKSLIHFHDYRFTKHERAMNIVCDEYWHGTYD